MMRTDTLQDCTRCDRLVQFRRDNAARFPEYHNAPVGRLGPPNARLLIVGLAPGLHGANRTGLPFTGDASGDLLFSALGRKGLCVDVGLVGCAIVNAVACCPPQNRPVAAEIRACRRFLTSHITDATEAILTLGTIAHAATLAALDLPKRHHPFAHARRSTAAGRVLVSSYHPSRYNVQTGRITLEMLEDAIRLCQPPST